MSEDSSSPGGGGGGRTAEGIFHDTAGWRNLETSIKCLQCMVGGCGAAFQPFLEQGLLDLTRVCLGHTNRFVRETGFYTLSSFIGTGIAADEPDDYKRQLAEDVTKGLADNWSQVGGKADQTVEYLRHELSVLCYSFRKKTRTYKACAL